MSKIFYTLRSEQWIARPLEEVFAFFSDAGNLQEITPPWLKFEILPPYASPIKEGSEIHYRLRWHGVPLRWTTEIRRWDPARCFVDIQRSGPYKLWHHTHRFETHDGGTKISDVVRYKLPFGWLGRIAHAVRVRSDVRKIFAYRRQRIEELFA